MSKLWKIALGTVGAGFLLLILFPVSQPLYNAPATSCMSNMKQLGLALVQYSQDSNNTLPSAASADGQGWREAVYPFLKSAGVYRCPSDAPGVSHDSPENLPKSYAANSALLGHSLASVNSNSVSAADTRGYEGEDWNMTSSAFLPDNGRELYAHLPRHVFYERPEGRLNLLFADGHVKRLLPADTLTPTNLWTRDNAPFAGQDLANAQAILRYAEKE